MSKKKLSFLGFLFVCGGGILDLSSLPQKDAFSHPKKEKSGNRFITQHIREQNKVKLRQASNHGPRFRAW